MAKAMEDEFGVTFDGEKPAKVAKKTRKMYTIFIDEEEQQPNYATVSVNGKVYKIPRGQDHDVPEEVIEVLKNTVASRLVQTESPVTGMIESREQSFNRIPYRIVRM